MGGRRICVIGAGVIGLATAVRLLEDWPRGSCHVTVMADAFNEDTTSDGAFGYWEPSFYGDTPLEKVRLWSKETMERMLQLATSPDAAASGTFIMPVFSLFRNGPPENSILKECCPSYRAMTEKELARYPGYRYGVSFTSAASEGRFYLPFLLKRFQSKGGIVVKRHLEALDQLFGDYDVIVNCSGLGARELCNDGNMVPIQGQVIRVDAPWLKHGLNADEDELYILPGIQNVVLGGTHGVGAWETEVSLAEKKRIFDDCCLLEPSLKASRVVRDWVGLRPGRHTVRLEKEIIRHQGGVVKIVHNYGHGGSGVTMHWGCAGEAARLAMEPTTPGSQIASKL